jgi:hypothetical protein
MNSPNVIADERGVIVHDSGWPRCYSCGRQSRDVASLHYRRADGVRGMSYPDCSDCREQNARRLERLGFTLTRAPREPK